MLKKFSILVLSLLVAATAFAQDDVTISRGARPSDGDLPSKTFSIDAGGFIFLGPQFIGELRLGDGTMYLSPHVRYGFLGLFTYTGFAPADDSTLEYTVSPLSSGAGLSLRKMLTSESSSNLFYIGGGVEYNYASATYTDFVDLNFEGQQDVKGLAVAFNLGYRWRGLENMFIGIGFQAGLNHMLFNQYYNTNTKAVIFDDTGKNIFFGVGNLTIGWEK